MWHIRDADPQNDVSTMKKVYFFPSVWFFMLSKYTAERDEMQIPKSPGQCQNETPPLPSSVDAKNVKAELKDGVLTVVLPKQEDAKTRQITVNAK
jgi:hypothetical protein